MVKNLPGRYVQKKPPVERVNQIRIHEYESYEVVGFFDSMEGVNCWLWVVSCCWWLLLVVGGSKGGAWWFLLVLGGCGFSCGCCCGSGRGWWSLFSLLLHLLQNSARVNVGFSCSNTATTVEKMFFIVSSISFCLRNWRYSNGAVEFPKRSFKGKKHHENGIILAWMHLQPY